jgi:hypothetical protein
VLAGSRSKGWCRRWRSRVITCWNTGPSPSSGWPPSPGSRPPAPCALGGGSTPGRWAGGGVEPPADPLQLRRQRQGVGEGQTPGPAVHRGR